MVDRVVLEQPRSNKRVALVTAQVMFAFVSLFVLVCFFVFFFLSFFFFFCLFPWNSGFDLTVSKYTIAFNRSLKMHTVKALISARAFIRIVTFTEWRVGVYKRLECSQRIFEKPKPVFLFYHFSTMFL